MKRAQADTGLQTGACVVIDSCGLRGDQVAQRGQDVCSARACLRLTQPQHTAGSRN